MIYTRTGDTGATDLIGGVRVRKDDPRVEAYGTVDELNSWIGLVAVSAGEAEAKELRDIQRCLFAVQTLLACGPGKTDEALRQRLSSAVSQLEQQIVRMEIALPCLHDFVLPGGTEAAARCHVARCVCRRAERRVVALPDTDGLLSEVRCYLNRLSDYLFVLSRTMNIRNGSTEICLSDNCDGTCKK